MIANGRRLMPGAPLLGPSSGALLLGALAVGCTAASSERLLLAPSAEPRAAPVPGMVIGMACVPNGPERCFDAHDDNCNGLIDEGCGLPTGLVQFVVAWNEPLVDVDLLVTGPDGELAEVGRATSIGLVKERDCPGSEGDCANQNLENVFLEEGDAPRGTYQVRVRLQRLGSASPPIDVTFGARLGPKTYAAELALAEVDAERRLVFEL
ncbi:MAG: hypothetical protein JW751_13305 [Polyangiaceae bacterium]|nr:hypothetical protein [Polyangiaceae bacterium]